MPWGNVRGYFVSRYLGITCIAHFSQYFLPSCFLRVFCTLLYDIKYSYLIQIILRISIWPHMGLQQIPHLNVKVDLGVMTIKIYNSFPRAQELEHNQNFSAIQLLEVLIVWGEYSNCIIFSAGRVLFLCNENYKYHIVENNGKSDVSVLVSLYNGISTFLD